jgi:DNA-binding MarR family transcriptional regulator
MSKRELITELRGAVRAAQVAVAARDQAIGERLGVNATDHRCLDLLDQRGPLTASALAQALGLTRSATTTVIDRLQALRYVQRASSARDRRQVLVELTPLLRRRAGELYGDQGEVQAVLGRYTAAELTLLLEFVRWDRDYNERRVRELTGG